MVKISSGLKNEIKLLMSYRQCDKFVVGVARVRKCCCWKDNEIILLLYKNKKVDVDSVKTAIKL